MLFPKFYLFTIVLFTQPWNARIFEIAKYMFSLNQVFSSRWKLLLDCWYLGSTSCDWLFSYLFIKKKCSRKHCWLCRQTCTSFWVLPIPKHIHTSRGLYIYYVILILFFLEGPPSHEFCLLSYIKLKKWQLTTLGTTQFWFFL